MNQISVWRRNSIFFYLTFFSAGTQGIITQLFVLTHYPEQKELLLPLILIIGSLAYIAGIWVSGKYLALPIYIAQLMLALNLAGFICILTVNNVIIYVVCYVIACFACNFSYNYLDHHWLDKNREGMIAGHVKSLLSYQMLAFMLAPLFFSISAGNRVLVVGMITAAAIVTGVPQFQKEERARKFRDYQQAVPIRTELSHKEKIFLCYTMIFMAIVVIAVAMMVYILSEYYMFHDYTVKSGVCLMIMSLASGLGILILKSPADSDMFTKDHRMFEYHNFRPWLQMLIVIITLAMTLLLLAKPFDSFLFVAFILSVLGLVYGFFLSSTRKFAGTVAVRNDKPELLTVFNNLQSISSLLAYGICIILSIVVRYINIEYYVTLFMIIVAALLTELALILVWLGMYRRQVDR